MQQNLGTGHHSQPAAGRLRSPCQGLFCRHSALSSLEESVVAGLRSVRTPPSLHPGSHNHLRKIRPGHASCSLSPSAPAALRLAPPSKAAALPHRYTCMPGVVTPLPMGLSDCWQCHPVPSGTQWAVLRKATASPPFWRLRPPPTWEQKAARRRRRTGAKNRGGTAISMRNVATTLSLCSQTGRW